MLFDQNRVDAIIHNWKNQVFSNETIPGVPRRHSTCLKPPSGGFRNLASSYRVRSRGCEALISEVLKSYKLLCAVARVCCEILKMLNCGTYPANCIVFWSPLETKLTIERFRGTTWLLGIYHQLAIYQKEGLRGCLKQSCFG